LAEARALMTRATAQKTAAVSFSEFLASACRSKPDVGIASCAASTSAAVGVTSLRPSLDRRRSSLATASSMKANSRSARCFPTKFVTERWKADGSPRYATCLMARVGSATPNSF
jgi:hypothetical protein